jgi:capsular polysaccharide biosynthesis protein
VNDPDRKITWPNGNGTYQDLPEGLWGFNDLTADREPSAAGSTGRLVSLGFIMAALKRRRRLWGTTAAVGVLLGCGLYLKSPPAYQASTSLLLTPGPYENFQTAPNNAQAMGQSVSVAKSAVRQLGLNQSASSFLATYKVVPITERVVTITASAPSSNQAVLNAGAVATAFLQFRAQEMQSEQKLVQAALDQQVKEAQQQLSSINSEISQLPAQSGSSDQQSQLKTLQAKQNQAQNTLYQTQQAALSNQTANGAATAAAVKGSVVMDAAVPLPHSRFKKLLLDAALGLILGLALGLGIVVIQAIVSDKPRRRDDVAEALGSPVRLSVRTAQTKRSLLGSLRALAPGARRGTQDAEIQRIAEHLRHAVHGRRGRGPATLAVVPVDDAQVPASSLVSLALSCAEEGQRVVVADLCSGAPAAGLLGSGEPGVQQVSTHGTRLVVAVPEPDDVTPVGPLHRSQASEQRSSFTEAVISACESANLLLTLTSLDPSLGGDYLATWTTDAVAVVTAGKSSWTRIHAVGEMVRLSDTHLASAVLVGADSTDETLGITSTPEMV